MTIGTVCDRGVSGSMGLVNLNHGANRSKGCAVGRCGVYTELRKDKGRTKDQNWDLVSLSS